MVRSPRTSNGKINYELLSEYLFYILFTALIIVSISKTMKVGTDYKVFYFAGKRILEGDMSLYDMLRDGILTYKYSPLFAVIFSPLSIMGYSYSLFSWCVFNSLSFILGWVACEKLLAANGLTINYKHRLLTLLFLLDVMTLNAQQANINAVVFGLVMYGVYLSMYSSTRWKGNLGLFLIALTASIKLTPLALLVFFFALKEYRKCAKLFFMFIIMMVLPVLYFGFSVYAELIKDWVFVLSDTRHFPFYKYTNQSVIAQLSRWMGENTISVKLIAAFMNTAVLFMVFYAARFKDLITALSMSIIFMLMASPVSWKEYQIILCLPLFYLNIKLINAELSGVALYSYLARILVVNIFVQAIIGEKLGLLANYHGNYLLGLLLMAVSLVLYKGKASTRKVQA